jgi:hypothetical protein
MSKFEAFEDYPKESVASAEACLLTVWPSLQRYREDLVLVGGLAIHYLTKRVVPGLPGAVTMDVDLGISLGASGGQYGTIKSDLSGLGFRSEGSRLVRQFGNLSLYLDFLTESHGAAAGSCIVDDVVASVFLGLNRALACRRSVEVRGRDLYGAERACTIKVADIGPMLVLKLNAFGGPTGRRLPKDAYDVLLAVTGFLDGPRAAVAGFQEEEKRGNSGYAYALATLERDFCDPAQDGPIRAAQFLRPDASTRNRIREDMATVGRILLGR